MHLTRTIVSEISPELVLIHPQLRSSMESHLPELEADKEFPEFARDVDLRSRLLVAAADSDAQPVTASVERDRRHGERVGRTLLVTLIVEPLSEWDGRRCQLAQVERIECPDSCQC